MRPDVVACPTHEVFQGLTVIKHSVSHQPCSSLRFAVSVHRPADQGHLEFAQIIRTTGSDAFDHVGVDRYGAADDRKRTMNGAFRPIDNDFGNLRTNWAGSRWENDVQP